ncbi:NfeD family protein [Halorussus sp. MSC15.2]|uniref:NfeD family protein n=1 Tax=Halorussus sp. MSC15.2 TaxID=2283638 RepID=UPI0013D300B4|nr:NfeD family protein [Halorussus sp. MSC15.2]NEU57642.1 NfeD family protein [Halorussus sp. MSC15.2]
MAPLLDSLPLLLLVAGIGLAIAEALIPGAHFVVLGVALVLAGLVGLLLGPAASPLLLAALVLGFGAASLYAYRELDLYGGKGVARTRDSDSLKGQTGRVTERVTTQDGQIKLHEGGFNPYYAARSIHGEIPEGTEVMVVDPGGGNVVKVEALEAIEDPIDRELRDGRESSSRDDSQRERDRETEET